LPGQAAQQRTTPRETLAAQSTRTLSVVVRNSAAAAARAWRRWRARAQLRAQLRARYVLLLAARVHACMR
jgi:hypothetical protein